MTQNNVYKGSLIRIGQTRAVVSEIYSNESIEVVYLNQSGHHVAEDVFLDGNNWCFSKNTIDATYAEKSPRLQQYISILKGK